MKILTSILLILLAYSNLQAQEDTIPPPIDFKKYVEIMTPEMCDSIYRVDTLYYPFEGDMQMIELRWKTARLNKIPCTYKRPYNTNIYNAFFDMSPIFIFRDKHNNFESIYNNNNNFIIDNKQFKPINFVNQPAYHEDYIVFEKHYKVAVSKYSGYHEPYLLTNKNKGLVNKKGKIILEAKYIDITLYKEEKSIKLKSRIDLFNSSMKLQYIDYNTFKPLHSEEYIFDRLRGYRRYDAFFNAQIVSINKKTYLVDNRGQLIFDLPIVEIHNTANYYNIVFYNGLSAILDSNFKYIIPPIYQSFNIHINKNNGDIDYIIALSQDKKIGIINKDNKVLLPIIYDYIININQPNDNNQDFLISKDGKFGIINNKFEFVMPIVYDSLKIYDNHIQAFKNNTWQIYNRDYKLIINDKFTSIVQDVDCILLLKADKTYILYDLDKPKPKYMLSKYKNFTYSHLDLKDKKAVYKVLDIEQHIEFKLLD